MGTESTGAPANHRGVNRYAPRSMALDPRTPVVVGVGQVATPPDAGLDPAARPEPLDLMTAALLAAAEDCDGAPAGGTAPAGRTLLERADSIRVVASLGWSTANPALAGGGAPRLRRGRRAGRAHGLVHRGQQSRGPHARRLSRHQPGRARRGARHRCRGHVRPHAGAPRPGPTLAGVGQPAGRHAAGVALRRGQGGRDRARDAARRDPADSRLPLVRERPARRQRLDAARSTAPASAASGPASARWPRTIPTPGSAPPARPTRS